jgi:hypothetical protein
MRPPVPAVFQQMAADLMQRVVPAISPAYHQGTIGMIATMLALAGEDWDRAASRRLEENRRLREIFREAANVIKKPGLNARLTELARTKDEDFRISALERNNCLLRATLIELQAQVESESGPEARRLEGSIWSELVCSTERRRVSSAPF